MTEDRRDRWRRLARGERDVRAAPTPPTHAPRAPQTLVAEDRTWEYIWARVRALWYAMRNGRLHSEVRALFADLAALRREGQEAMTAEEQEGVGESAGESAAQKYALHMLFRMLGYGAGGMLIGLLIATLILIGSGRLIGAVQHPTMHVPLPPGVGNPTSAAGRRAAHARTPVEPSPFASASATAAPIATPAPVDLSGTVTVTNTGTATFTGDVLVVSTDGKTRCSNAQTVLGQFYVVDLAPGGVFMITCLVLRHIGAIPAHTFQATPQQGCAVGGPCTAILMIDNPAAFTPTAPTP